VTVTPVIWSVSKEIIHSLYFGICCGGHCADHSEEATWESIPESDALGPGAPSVARGVARSMSPFRASSSTGWSRDLEVPRG
jgi:hypothetical protein